MLTLTPEDTTESLKTVMDIIENRSIQQHKNRTKQTQQFVSWLGFSFAKYCFLIFCFDLC